MPDIILPKPANPSGSRRRSVDAPAAADVPTIDPAVARDPGLDVPAGAFGGGLGEGLEVLGKTVSGISDDVLQAVVRQKKLNDATEKEKFKGDLRQQLRDDLAQREDGAAFADEPVRGAFNAFVDTQVDEAKNRARAVDGASRLSDAAMARFDLDLDHIGQVFRDRSDTLHLQGVERRGIDQLNSFVDEAAVRARRFVASAPGNEAFFTLGAELDMLDEAVAPFDGAFTAISEQDIRAAGRVRIIEAAVTGLAENGRGDEAQTLLDHDDFAGDLDEATSARLTNNIHKLTRAHDRDRTARDQREAAEEARKRETAALAFTTNFRPRMATGDATLTEIATAETGGVLTTAQAERLRAELAEAQSRRDQNAERTGRVASVLQDGGRLDPEDFDDRDDAAHHYEATLKPSLPDLDPAQKAAAISGYVAETGIAPNAALNALLALTVTGDPANRIAAARELVAVFNTDPTARDNVLPALADFAELIRSLADTDAIPPGDIVKVGDGLIRDLSPGATEDRPDPGLVLLAKARTDAGAQTDGQTDAGVEDAPEETPQNTPSDSASEAGSQLESTDANPGTKNAVPEFKPDDVARVADLARRLDAQKKPPLTTGTIRRGADQIDASTRQAKAEATEAEKKLGDVMLRIIPGLGEVMSAGDAIKAFREARKLQAEGKLDEALEKRVEAGVATLGAIPFVGEVGRFTRAIKAIGQLARLVDLDQGGKKAGSSVGVGRSGNFKVGLGLAKISAEERKKAIAANPFDPNFVIRPEAPKKTLRTKAGPFAQILAEQSTEDLEKFRNELDGIIGEKTVEVRALTDEIIALEGKEEPIRQEIEKLENLLKAKFGIVGGMSLFDLVKKRALSVLTLIDIVGAVDDHADLDALRKDLGVTFDKKMKIRKGEGKEIGEDARRRELKRLWIRRWEIEAEFEARKNERAR